jgi:hypothetical protein
LASGRILIANKASAIGTIGISYEPAVKFLQVASVVAKQTYTAGVLAHYFTMGEHVLVSTGGPMRLFFKEAEDAVVLAYKTVGAVLYLYGITVDNLINWSPPSKPGQLVDESGVLQSWKSTHADIVSLEELEDTETHNLRAMADKLISHLASWRIHNIRSAKVRRTEFELGTDRSPASAAWLPPGLCNQPDVCMEHARPHAKKWHASADLTGCVVRCALSSQDARAWCEKGFEPTIKSLLTQSELEERKLAKEKSDTARDKSTVESRAGGLAARELWAARKTNLLACGPYYQDSFRERFITIALDETSGQPTQTAIDELRTHLGCAAHSAQRLTLPTLPNMGPPS